MDTARLMMLAAPRCARCKKCVDALIDTISASSPRNRNKLLAMQLHLFASSDVNTFFQKQLARVKSELHRSKSLCK